MPALVRITFAVYQHLESSGGLNAMDNSDMDLNRMISMLSDKIVSLARQI